MRESFKLRYYPRYTFNTNRDPVPWWRTYDDRWGLCADEARNYFSIPRRAKQIRIVVSDTGVDAEGYVEPDVYAVQRCPRSTEQILVYIDPAPEAPERVWVARGAAALVQKLCNRWQVPVVWVGVEVIT